MGSVAATNPGVTDLLNIISNEASPALSSLLSSSKVQSALQNASPADLVQLSDQALKLQAVEGLFGNPDTSQTGSNFDPNSSFNPNPSQTLQSILAGLQPGSAGSATASPATSPAPSVASQLAVYQGQLQAEDTQALFGTAAGASGTAVNLLA